MERSEEQLLHGCRVLFYSEENVLELDRGGGGKQCKCTKATDSCTQK